MPTNAGAESMHSSDARPRMVVGVTHPQTCMILTPGLRALREAGFNVTLVCSPGDLLTETAEAAGVSALAIPIARSIAPVADLVSLWRLWRALRKLRPAITEFSTPKAGLLGTLAAAFAGVPNRIYFIRGLKLESASGLKRWILLIAEKAASLAASQVLCNSESLRAEVLGLGITRRAKIQLLGDGSSAGVDLLRFSPGSSEVRESLNIPATAEVIGFVGRLTRDKGLPELLTAFKEILRVKPKSYLLLVGWFDLSEDALDREFIAQIAINRQIRATGMVAETAPYYRAMDLLVLPTRREGFPNVILEAAATGLPVITTLSTGARDTVVPEVTGLLVPPGYPEAIEEAVLKLLGDAERRKSMGQAARAWVGEHFSREKVLAKNIEFYRGLMRGKRKFSGANRTESESAPDQLATFISGT